jgi:hypothetical protein
MRMVGKGIDNYVSTTSSPDVLSLDTVDRSGGGPIRV